ncbi:MAG: sulfotransferase domain-containing protein [Pseudomonadota bacterium]|nr:sulfotransferase domain-containing protein [Pseudomonadota bacterium]
MQTELTARWIGRRLGLRVPLTVWRHMGLREEDVFLASYPKSGNTWLAFLVATALTGEEIDFDRIGDIIPGVIDHKGRGFISASGGRIIRTHEMWRPRYRKGIYIVRDGRDVAVSYYHHQTAGGLFCGEFSEFLRWFAAGGVDGYGSWARNVESWMYKIESRPESFIVLRYENMLADPAGELERVLDFLGGAMDRERIEYAVWANEKSRMRGKEGNSHFLKSRIKRKGASFVRSASAGQWAKYFDEDDQELFEKKLGRVNSLLGYE